MKSTILVSIVCLLTILFGCVSSIGTQNDDIPMYGQPAIERSEVLKKADQDFIDKFSNAYGSRREASESMHAEGEKFMRQNNLDYAMRRYNQSWLLDPNNYQPYWGFARAMVAKQQYEEAFKYFQKSIELNTDAFQKSALLSDVAIAYHNKAYRLSSNKKDEKEKYFGLANKYFEESTKLDPKYTQVWLKWAYSLYFQGDYTGSWNKVKNLRELGANNVPADLVDKLNKVLLEPN